MKTNRNNFVDLLRGTAILMVVLGHTLACTSSYRSSYLFNIIWSIQMPLFFVISGFVTKYQKKIETFSSLLKFILRKTLVYLLPWFSWTVLVRGFLFHNNNFLNFKYMIYHMDAGYWFLFVLWFITICNGIINFILSKHYNKFVSLKQNILYFTLKCILFLVPFICMFFLGIKIGFNFLTVKLILYYIPFYLMGCFISMFYKFILDGSFYKKYHEILYAILLFIYFCIISNVNLFYANGLNIIFRVLASIFGCILLMKIFYNFSNSKNKYLQYIFRCIEWCGYHSLEIYLVHYLFLNKFIVVPLPNFYELKGIFSILFNCSITISLSICLIKILSKNRVLNFLLFSKKN